MTSNPGFKRVPAEHDGLCFGCANYAVRNGRDGPAGLCEKICIEGNPRIDGRSVIAVRDAMYTPVTSTGTDTATAAAIAIKPKRLSIKDTILALLAAYPAGLTGEEIAQRGNLRLNSVTPRFAELTGTVVMDIEHTDTNHRVLLRTPKIKDSGLRRSGQIVWKLNKE